MNDLPPIRVMHSERFRRVANGYPRAVAVAYDGDIERAAMDDDETVAANVADWERRNGISVRDWRAIGESERDPDDEYYSDDERTRR